MEEFVNQEQAQSFFKKSSQTRFAPIVYQQPDPESLVHFNDRKRNKQKSNIDPQQLKEQITKRVESYTIDQVTRELLRDNSLVLTKQEKEYQKLQETAFLIKKGAQVKQKYMSIKDLSAKQKLERSQRLEREEELRGMGAIGQIRSGKMIVLETDRYKDESEISIKKQQRHILKIASSFSDRRGVKKHKINKAGTGGITCEHVVRSMKNRK